VRKREMRYGDNTVVNDGCVIALFISWW